MITLPPKLQDFVNKLGEMMAFISPEYRPSIIPTDDYTPFGQDHKVTAVIIGNNRLAAFVHFRENYTTVDEVVRVEEIDPWINPRSKDDDPARVTANTNYRNASAVLSIILADYTESFKKKDFEADRNGNT